VKIAYNPKTAGAVF